MCGRAGDSSDLCDSMTLKPPPNYRPCTANTKRPAARKPGAECAPAGHRDLWARLRQHHVGVRAQCGRENCSGPAEPGLGALTRGLANRGGACFGSSRIASLFTRSRRLARELTQTCRYLPTRELSPNDSSSSSIHARNNNFAHLDRRLLTQIVG